MYDFFLKITEIIHSLGYIGIFVTTFVEGTLIPIPSELTMVPAGYLVAKGEFSLFYTLLFGITGTLAGVLFSYYLACHFGRPILLKYGKYCMMNEKKLQKIERFFAKYGHISTLVGRMLPGVKHFIAFPAGLGRMDIKIFIIYSIIGASFWIALLVFLGYHIGENEALLAHYLKQVNAFLLPILVAIIVIFYIIRERREKKREE